MGKELLPPRNQSFVTARSPEYRELIQEAATSPAFSVLQLNSQFCFKFWDGTAPLMEVTNCGELCERVDLATQASLHDAWNTMDCLLVDSSGICKRFSSSMSWWCDWYTKGACWYAAFQHAPFITRRLEPSLSFWDSLHHCWLTECMFAWVSSIVSKEWLGSHCRHWAMLAFCSPAVTVPCLHMAVWTFRCLGDQSLPSTESPGSLCLCGSQSSFDWEAKFTTERQKAKIHASWACEALDSTKLQQGLWHCVGWCRWSTLCWSVLILVNYGRRGGI